VLVQLLTGSYSESKGSLGHCTQSCRCHLDEQPSAVWDISGQETPKPRKPSHRVTRSGRS